MKKEMLIIAVLFMIIPLFVSATLPAFADIGTDINTYWAYTKPTINGTIAPGEWTDAAVRSFTLAMRSRADNSVKGTLNGKLYVKNDYNNLYIAVQIFNDTYWATDFQNRWKGLAILFNYNDNGTLGQGERGEGITTWTGSPFYSKNDLYYDVGSTSWLSNAVNNGAMNFTHTNPVTNKLGNWTFEMSIPLVSSDFNLAKAQMPKEIGYKLWFSNGVNATDGVYPDDTSIYPLNQIANAKTYGDFIINPLYYLTIQTTPGGTTNPVPGVYPYGYGTMVSVTAIANVGYMLDHWLLDTVNVGAANPYVVTMYQNHTLQAVFKTIPLVGGVSLKPTALPSLAYYGTILVAFGAAVSVIRRKKR